MLHFVFLWRNIKHGKDVSKMIKLVRFEKMNNGEMSFFAHVLKRK